MGMKECSLFYFSKNLCILLNKLAWIEFSNQTFGLVTLSGICCPQLSGIPGHILMGQSL